MYRVVPEEVRERLTENREEGSVGQVRSEQDKCRCRVTAHSAADDGLQSMSHQLASNQSIPLMIFNHTGTGCPTVTSISPLSSNQAKKLLWTQNKIDIKTDTSAAHS